MPVIPSWNDYVPEEAQVRDVEERATKKAKEAADRLASASDRECAEALVDATAEGFRLLALRPRGGTTEAPFKAAFERAKKALRQSASRRAVAGVLAFANLRACGTGRREDDEPDTTREWLDLAAGIPSSTDADAEDIDRLLGFAALAAGSYALAMRFSTDAALAQLVAVVDGPPEDAWRAFVDFVEAFPTASHGYGELGFVARAYVTHVGRGQGAIAWLRETIHTGATRPASFEPPPPPPPPPPPIAPTLTVPDELAARVRPLLAPADRALSQRLSFRVALHDIHGLWGGRAIRVGEDGTIEVVVKVGSMWRYRGRLSDQGVAELEALNRRVPIRKMTSSQRNGIAGEAMPSLTIVDGDGKHSAARWAGDCDDAFSWAKRVLDEIAQVVSASSPAEDVAGWDGVFTADVVPISAAIAYLLAYLTARRVTAVARSDLLDRHASDPSLAQAIAFTRRALHAEASTVTDVDRRLSFLASRTVVVLPAPPNEVTENAVTAWLVAIEGAVRPYLTTPALEGAWHAGEAARLVTMCVALSANVAHLRCASPGSAALRAEAEGLARDLSASATALRGRLEALQLRHVTAHADDVPQLIREVPDLTPTQTPGVTALLTVARQIERAIEATATQIENSPMN